MFELKHPPVDNSERKGDSPETLQLHCTRGQPAPAELASDLERLLELPGAVKTRFFEVLVPYLGGQPDQRQSEAIAELCKQHELEPETLVPAIKAARFVITNAALSGITRDAFIEDVSQLATSGNKRELIGLLLACFDQAVPAIRSEIASHTVADHGKLVQRTHWRIEKIINSEHGDGIDLPVAVLSFDYHDGPTTDRVTLHFLPEQLGELKNALERMLR